MFLSEFFSSDNNLSDIMSGEDGKADSEILISMNSDASDDVSVDNESHSGMNNKIFVGETFCKLRGLFFRDSDILNEDLFMNQDIQRRIELDDLDAMIKSK